MKAKLKSGRIVEGKLAETFVRINIATEITEEIPIIEAKEVKSKKPKVQADKLKQKRVYKKKVK